MGGYFPGGDVEKKEEGKLSKASKDRCVYRMVFL